MKNPDTTNTDVETGKNKTKQEGAKTMLNLDTKLTINDLKQKLDEMILELHINEMSENTIISYKSCIESFISFMRSTGHETLTYQCKCDWKKDQLDKRDRGDTETSTVNIKISKLNKFFEFLGLGREMRMRSEKVQKQFVLTDVLEKQDFEKMVEACKSDLNKHKKDLLIITTLATTGIRVSELKYFTVQNIQQSNANHGIRVINKGKERIVPIPQDLKEMLLEYCKTEGIENGCVFHSRIFYRKTPKLDKNGHPVLNRNGNPVMVREIDEEKSFDRYGNAKPMSDRAVETSIKKIAKMADVEEKKAYPHSFRHFAAREWEKNGMPLTVIQKILGHSNITTTANYYTTPTEKELIEMATEHSKKILTSVKGQ